MDVGMRAIRRWRTTFLLLVTNDAVGTQVTMELFLRPFIDSPFAIASRKKIQQCSP
jgi:hypothetical protein